MHVSIDCQTFSEDLQDTNLACAQPRFANSANPRRILNFTPGLVFAASTRRAHAIAAMVATRSARRATASQKSQKSQFSRAKVVFAVLAAVAFQLLLTSLDLPLLKVGRNLVASTTPDPLPPKYACDDLSQKLTVVVTVKDACSQMPGFVKALEPVVGTQTSLILTYPNLTACDPSDLKVDLAPWRDVTTVPLPPSSSPMRGWSDSVGLIKTEFALLLRPWAASDYASRAPHAPSTRPSRGLHFASVASKA